MAISLGPPRRDTQTAASGTEGSPHHAAELGANGTTRSTRRFTLTFAIAAFILVAAFLVALYLSSNRMDVAINTAPQAPETNTAPGPAGGSNGVTGSTTAPRPQQVAPGTGDAGTGGNTAPATP